MADVRGLKAAVQHLSDAQTSPVSVCAIPSPANDPLTTLAQLMLLPAKLNYSKTSTPQLCISKLMMHRFYSRLVLMLMLQAHHLLLQHPARLGS